MIAGHYFDADGHRAAFRRLGDLIPGDLISIELSDGRVIGYEVMFNKTAPPGELDWGTLYTATAIESLTLITAAGDGQQDGIRVVWGRIPF